LDIREEMLVAFRLFDTDKRGKIGLKDLKRIARELEESITDEELLMILDECDRDRDGEINEEDWIRIMARQ
jgi:centrin-1